MSEQSLPFTIESFYSQVGENRLMAAKCSNCGNLLLPPKPICTKCLSKNLKWIELDGIGKLLSYTVIHIAPEQFQSMTPYTVGIVEFKNGLRLPGMIRDLNSKEIKVGMPVKIDFEQSTSSQWPAWSKYFFRPL